MNLFPAKPSAFVLVTLLARLIVCGVVQLLRVDAKERELLGQAWSGR